MGRKRKNYYFTEVTEKAIIRYNNEERPAMRNRIYNDHIAAAFDKLCENLNVWIIFSHNLSNAAAMWSLYILFLIAGLSSLL